MKYIVTIIIASMALLSCKKNSNSAPSYYVTAQINGKPFTATFAESYFGTNTTMTITASTKDYYFTFFENNYNGNGTYQISDPYGITSYYQYAASTPTGYVQTGIINCTVTITSHSPNLVGTFSFTATDSTKVTNGQFVLKGY